MQRNLGEYAQIFLDRLRRLRLNDLNISELFKFQHIVTITSLLVILAVVTGLPAYLPKQVASWLTFVTILIVPGFILTQIVTDKLNLDLFQQMALAFPMGVALLALPGLLALLLHLTISGLFIGWLFMACLTILVYAILARSKRVSAPSLRVTRTWDEILLGLLLLAAYIYIFPALTTFKMDGDLYTFLSKVSDALAGRPMNITEPIFGTDLQPGVRSEFNQFLPIWSLWAYLSRLDPVVLTGFTSRSMLALWALLAAYTLGKEAGNRRLGLFTAAIQLLIYLAAPFFRADNVSLFFFERTNADKFTVSVTMLPVIFALCISYLRDGRRAAWKAALISAFAVSTIHPLIASMLALGIAAFAGLHLFIQRSRSSFIRVFHLVAIAGVAMSLPIILLFMARGGTPLAPTYPQDIEGWPVGKELSPALPLIRLPNLDWYGPLPKLSSLTAEDANTDQNPFLIWRYAFNMRRQRLFVFDVNSYISDPSTVTEPPYLLALLLLPLLLRRLRSDIGAQYGVSNALAIIFVMFNPFLTPKIGSLVVPWLLWRFIWLLPYSLIISLAIFRIFDYIAVVFTRLLNRLELSNRIKNYGYLGLIIGISVWLGPHNVTKVQQILFQEGSSQIFPSPERLFSRLKAETLLTGPVTVAADQNISVTIPVYAPNANIIGHRVFNTSEFFPADQQDIALQRLIDQQYLFNTPYITETSIEILHRYNVRFIVVPSAGALNFQLSLAPEWFEWLIDDNSFSLYAVKEIPAITDTIRGNAALNDRNWEVAERYFQAALEQKASDMLALAGLVAASREKGDFDHALLLLQQISVSKDVPVVQYTLGQLYLEMGQLKGAIRAFDRASQAAPNIARYHLALGEACLRDGDLDCAAREYERSVAGLSDQAAQLMTVADHWLQRGKPELALSMYEEAVKIKPSEENQLTLSSVYQDLELFDQAEAQLVALEDRYPFSAEVLLRLAQLKRTQSEIDQAIEFYRRAVRLQELKVKDSIPTRIALAQTLLDADRIDEANKEIDAILAIQPYNASAYILKGNFFSLQNNSQEAVVAYRKALELDPTLVAAYTSLRDEYHQQAALDENLDLLILGTERNPDEPVLFLSLGDQLQRLGSLETAISAYQLALDLLKTREVFPRFSRDAIERSQALAYTRLAAVYEDLGQIRSAMSNYQAAVTAAPSNVRSQVLLGDALRRRNELEAAEGAYREAIENDPTYLGAYLQLAGLLGSQGDLSGAADLYDQAMDVFFDNPDQSRKAVGRLDLEILLDQQMETNALIGSGGEAQTLADNLLDPANKIDTAAFVQILETYESPPSVQLLAQFYVRTNQPDKALALYKSKIQEGDTNKLPPAILAQYYSGLGGLLANMGQIYQAIDAYHQAISLDGSAVIPRLGLAQALVEAGDTSDALMELEKAVERSPGSIEAQLSLANVLEKTGDWEKALAIYRTSAQSRPGNERANIALARALRERNYWTEAEEIYRKVIDLVPNSANAYFGLANLYLTQARVSEAETLLREATQIDHLFIEAYLAKGDLMARFARYAEAEGAYRQAMRVEPRNERAYTGLAEVYRTQGEIEKALDILKEAAAINPSSVEPLRELASLYRQQNEPGLAEDTLLLALDRSPGDMQVRFALAQLYQSRARSEAALEQLRLAVEEHAESVEALVFYADGLRERGRSEEAEAYYERAEQEGQPSAVGYRALAAARQAQGRLEEALALAKQAIALAPNDPVNWLVKADVQTQTGYPSAALDSLQQATDIAPAQAQPWHALGVALLAAGQREQGIATLERAIAVEPAYLPAYGSLIEAYPFTEQADKVAEIVAAAREAVPGSYLVDIYQARALQELSRWEEAETAFEQAIAKAPGLAEPYLAMGTFLARRHRLSEAINSYKEAINVEPQNTQAHNGLTLIYRSIIETDFVAILALLETDIPEEAHRKYIEEVGNLLARIDVSYDPELERKHDELMNVVTSPRPPSIVYIRKKIIEFKQRFNELTNDTNALILAKAAYVRAQLSQDLGPQESKPDLAAEFHGPDNLFSIKLRASWAYEEIVADYLVVNSFISSDGHALVQHITYDEGKSLSVTEAGLFALELLQNLHEEEIKITGDRLQAGGSEQLSWQSASEELKGVSLFEIRGTKFLLLTAEYDAAYEEFYQDVLAQIIDTYKIQ